MNSLIAAGATRADFGLNQAQRAFQLGGTREGAQKVVVFFTDGQPTSNSDWSNSVAAAAITNAKEFEGCECFDLQYRRVPGCESERYKYKRW